MPIGDFMDKLRARCGGGLHRPGEEQAGVWQVDVAGIGERLDSREFDPDGSLRCGYRRLPHR